MPSLRKENLQTTISIYVTSNSVLNASTSILHMSKVTKDQFQIRSNPRLTGSILGPAKRRPVLEQFQSQNGQTPH